MIILIHRLVTQQAIKKWSAIDHEDYPLLAEVLWKSLNETPSLRSQLSPILPIVGRSLFYLISQSITQSSHLVIQESVQLLPYEMLSEYSPEMMESLLPSIETLPEESLHEQIISLPPLIQTILKSLFIQCQDTTIETEIRALLCLPTSFVERLVSLTLHCLDVCLRQNTSDAVMELFVHDSAPNTPLQNESVLTTSPERRFNIESTLILITCVLIRERSDLSKSTLLKFTDSLYRILQIYNEKSLPASQLVTEMNSTQEYLRENAIQVIQGIGAPIIVELSRLVSKTLSSTPFLDRFITELNIYLQDPSSFGASLLLFYCRYLGDHLDDSRVQYLFDRLLPSFLHLAQKPMNESIERSFEKVLIDSVINN